MGYVLKVRLASFFTGAAVASAAGIYFLHKDYKIAHHAISQQNKLKNLKNVRNNWAMAFKMNSLYESLDGRLSAMEKLKEVEATKHVEATE